MSRAHAPGRTFYSFPEPRDTIVFRSPWIEFNVPWSARRVAQHFAVDVGTAPPRVIMSDGTAPPQRLEAPATDGVIPTPIDTSATAIARRQAAFQEEFRVRMRQIYDRWRRELEGYCGRRAARGWCPTSIRTRPPTSDRDGRRRRLAPPPIPIPPGVDYCSHPRCREPLPPMIAADGDFPGMVETTIQVCRTLVRDLITRGPCDCGAYFGVETAGRLELHAIGGHWFPRFRPVETVEEDYGHAVRVVVTVLDRADALLTHAELRVHAALGRHRSVRHEVITRTAEQLARRYLMDEREALAELDTGELEALLDRVASRSRTAVRQIGNDLFLLGRSWPGGDDRLATPPGEEHWVEFARTQERLAPADRGHNDVRSLPSPMLQYDNPEAYEAALAAERTPDVPPPSKEQWAALEAKIDAAAPPARKSVIDMIQRCAGNSDSA